MKKENRDVFTTQQMLNLAKLKCDTMFCPTFQNKRYMAKVPPNLKLKAGRPPASK